MDKEDVVHIYHGILLSHKKEWNNAICSNMDGPRDYHTKWNKSERERQIPYDIIYVESKISHKSTYLQNRNRLTDRERTDLWLLVGRGTDWEFGISRCKLVYTGWKNNKVLLYITGSYIQYLVINHNEYEKESIYIYTNKRVKRQATEWEKIFSNHRSDKGLIPSIKNS